MQGHQVEIVHADTPEESAKLAVRAVHHKTADVLMKGNVPTSVLLKAVLNRQEGLRSSSVLSHVAVFDIPDFDRLMFVTDSAMNIAPSLEELRQICKMPFMWPMQWGTICQKQLLWQRSKR